jgi:diguanylate cyclase (GGDEF)-like protein
VLDPIDRLRSLREFARAGSVAGSVAELVDLSAAAAKSLLSADEASVIRLEPSYGRVRVLRNLGALETWEQEWPADSTYSLRDVPHTRAFAGLEADTWVGSVDDPDTDPAEAQLLRRLGKRHAAAFGIRFADRPWGEIYATRASADPFDHEELAVGLTLVELVSFGLSRLDLLSDLTTYAYTDPLTGVANRRAADEWLERRLAGPEPFPPVSIVLCDINGLKQINDAFGHTAGDALIQLVATHLSAAADEMADALAARIGGDEFVLLADDVAEEQVETVVARLAATQLPHGAGIAVGAATTRSRPAGAESSNTAIRALMRLADAAQYRHKQTKRLSARSLEAAPSSVAVLYPQGEEGLADRVLERLAQGTDRSVEWRLQVVGDAMAEAFMAASWWVSRCDDSSLVDVLGRIVRDDSRGALAQMDWVSGTEFDLDLYPATARALSGGSYYATLTEGDQTERSFLARMGAVSALAAGDRDAAGLQWLLELLGDPRTSAGLAIARPLLRALVHVAVVHAEPAPMA